MPGFLVFLLIAAIVGGFVAWVMWLMKKRTQELQAISQSLQFEFSPTGNNSIAPLLSNLEFFAYGTRKVSNLMKGQINRNGKPVTVAIFDYQYTVGNNLISVSFGENSGSVSSGSDVESFIQTVIVFYDESLDIPGFRLRPEGLIDKLGNLIGFEDINFRSFPVFSKRYRLDAINVDRVRNLFQPNLIRFYEKHQMQAEANGSMAVIFPFASRGGSQETIKIGSATFVKSDTIEPDEIQAYLDLGLKLLDLVEKNLVEQHAGATS